MRKANPPIPKSVLERIAIERWESEGGRVVARNEAATVRRMFTGHAEVRSFFERILSRLDMTAFNPVEFVIQGKTVVVFGNESGTVKATGQSFHNEWVQKYVVEDALIVEMTEWNIQTEPDTQG